MRAGEHQRKAVVGDFHLSDFVEFGEQQQMLFARFAGLPPARGVDEPALRRRHQPGFWIAGHAVGGPVHQRRGEGLGQRVLGPGDVARARGEERDQLAVTATRNLFGRFGRLAGRVPAHIAMIGRTSIEPALAPGQRAAQERAASRSGTSTM